MPQKPMYLDQEAFADSAYTGENIKEELLDMFYNKHGAPKETTKVIEHV